MGVCDGRVWGCLVWLHPFLCSMAAKQDSKADPTTTQAECVAALLLNAQTVTWLTLHSEPLFL